MTKLILSLQAMSSYIAVITKTSKRSTISDRLPGRIYKEHKKLITDNPNNSIKMWGKELNRILNRGILNGREMILTAYHWTQHRVPNERTRERTQGAEGVCSPIGGTTI